MQKKLPAGAKSHPSPRIRGKKRNAALPSFVRFILLIVVAGVVAFAAVLLVQKIARPVMFGYGTKRRIHEMDSTLKQQHERNRVLQAKLDFLRSKEGAETLARRLGYHREGEEVTFLQRPNEPATPQGTN